MINKRLSLQLLRQPALVSANIRGAIQRLRLAELTSLAGVLTLGLVLRTLPWTRPNYLTGVLEYDDGVYYAAALGLIHAQVPYADFVFLHPPGIIFLMAPLALLGQVSSQPLAMAAARVTMVVVGLATIVLIWRLTRGTTQARIAAAVAYAVAPAVLLAERTVLLEPLLNLCCVLALGVLFQAELPGRRAVRSAGLIVGLAAAIKLFAVVYPVAIGLWLLSRRQPRLALLHVVTAAASFTLVLFPFLLLAPTATVRDVLLTQLRRPESGIPIGSARASDLLQLAPAAGHQVPSLVLLSAALAAAALMLARLTDLRTRLLSMVLLLTTAGFLLAPSYYSHYAAFLLPPAALLVGKLATASQASTSKAGRVAGRIAVACILLILALGGVRTTAQTSGRGDVRAAAARLPHRPQCVFTDSASLAISANLLRAPSIRCPGWVDGRGYALALSISGPLEKELYNGGFRRLEQWQLEIRRQLEQADAILVRGSPATLEEWSDTTRQYATDHFRPVARSSGGPPWELWTRVDRP